MRIIKKDGRLEPVDFEKIKIAITKSGARIHYTITDEEFSKVVSYIDTTLTSQYEKDEDLPVAELHLIVEEALNTLLPQVGEQYRNYRNYKKDYAKMMESVIKSADDLNYHTDRSNANTSAALVSTKRSLVYTAFNKELYKKVFISSDELEAIEKGYIYIHDLGARMDTYNCCLFDMGKVLQGGFEWEHIQYNEPKDVRTACNLISDITLNCAAQQYGGFTLAEIDSILAPYARKSYKKHYDEYMQIVADIDRYETTSERTRKRAHDHAMKEVEREIAQGFQGFEHTFNTVASSRGDYPFVTMTGGVEEDEFGQLVWRTALKVRREGQGKPGHKRPAIFPKLVFLYTKELHAPGKPLYDLYKEGVICSSQALYPDWLSLDEPQNEIAGARPVSSSLADTFKKYHKFGVSRWVLDNNENVQENPEWVDSIVSPMGCRAYLSPIYKSGKLHPVDESDTPIFQGRFNGGAISLNLPMIYAAAKRGNVDFYDLLDFYLDMINRLHIKTYDFLCKLKASCNPVAFCEGGFGKLKPTDNIKPLVDKITFSYGFTALNELQQLATGKSLYQAHQVGDNFAYNVLKYINDYVEQKKVEREQGTIPYIAAIYGTPAESLCGTQLQQFVKEFGIIENVSDKAYFTNSFHMWVGENISPWEKQDAEFKYFHTAPGGHIQYCRFANGLNLRYLDQTITRAMKLGYYFGVNIEKSYCGDCGTEMDDGITICPHCGSTNITTINRVCGYLGYSRVDGTSKMNDAKLAEIKDRKSM